MASDEYENIAAVILAAGYSSRMDQPKALLQIDGVTFLESIIAKLNKIDIREIIIVLGDDSKKIQSQISMSDDLLIVENHQPEQGQLSSIKLAIRNMTPGINGFLLTLVDHPLVSQATYETIVKHSERDPNKIVIPVYNNKNGHPVYFGRDFSKDLLQAPLDEGARSVVRKYPDRIRRVDVQDSGILRDIDLPEDYEKYVAGGSGS